MRMQSTSCCFNSAGAPTRCFNSAADMVCLPRYALPLDLAADLAAPQVPGAHARGLVDGVGKPAFLEVERGDRRTALERAVQCWMRALTSVYTARNTAVCSVGPQATLPCARMSATFFLPMTAARATPLSALLTSMSVARTSWRMSNTGTPSAMKAALWNIACIGTPTSPERITEGEWLCTME